MTIYVTREGNKLVADSPLELVLLQINLLKNFMLKNLENQ